MFEMRLIQNNDYQVTYQVFDYDQKLDKGTITVNKSDGSYVLSKGKVIDNKFTAATYRVIKECLKDGFYPEKYANGWGWIF